MTFHGITPVLVIRGAGAFGGNHGRSQRLLGRAANAEGGAIDGFFQALQHLRADALGRLFHSRVRQAEDSLGVVFGELGTQAEAALRDGPDAAPFAVRHLENLQQNFLGDAVAFQRDRTHVLVLGLGAAFFELRHQHPNGLDQIHRLESAHHDGNLVLLC